MLYLGLVLGTVIGFSIGVLLTQAKISDLELELMAMDRRLSSSDKVDK